MELRCVEGVPHWRRWRRGAPRTRRRLSEAVGKARDLVPTAHPHLMLFADLPQAVEQAAGLRHPDKGAAEFAAVARQHFAAQLPASSSADHSRCQVIGTPASNTSTCGAGLSSPHHRGWPPDRMTPAASSGKSLRRGVEGAISPRDPASRTRRAISCVTWLPKSMMRMESLAGLTWPPDN